MTMLQNLPTRVEKRSLFAGIELAGVQGKSIAMSVLTHEASLASHLQMNAYVNWRTHG
jgi:hypothetical protein